MSIMETTCRFDGFGTRLAVLGDFTILKIVVIIKVFPATFQGLSVPKRSIMIQHVQN